MVIPFSSRVVGLLCGLLCGAVAMRREELEALFNEFNPDEEGKVSRSAIFATYAANTAQPPSSKESMKKLRGRRRSSSDVQQISELRRTPRPVDMAPGSETASEDAIDFKGLLPPVSRILATSSRADQGTEAVGDAEDRIDFKGLRARVEGAKQTRAQGLEARLYSDATPAADGVNVEARTPPAMERNLFLSALANGKLEVIEMQPESRWSSMSQFTPWRPCDLNVLMYTWFCGARSCLNHVGCILILLF